MEAKYTFTEVKSLQLEDVKLQIHSPFKKNFSVRFNSSQPHYIFDDLFTLLVECVVQ